MYRIETDVNLGCIVGGVQLFSVLNFFNLTQYLSYKSIEKLSKLNSFRVERMKNDVILHIFTRLRVQGYRCKSGIAIFSWSITVNDIFNLKTALQIFTVIQIQKAFINCIKQ